MQEHLHDATDIDARVGHKTADCSFFDYKTHAAIRDERMEKSNRIGMIMDISDVQGIAAILQNSLNYKCIL